MKNSKVLSITMEPLGDKLAVHITYPNHRETKFLDLSGQSYEYWATWGVIWRAIELEAERTAE